MRQSPRIQDAANALTVFLNNNAGEINTNLANVLSPGKSVAPVTVLPYYTDNIDEGMTPLLMIEFGSISREWEALNTGSGPVGKAYLSLTITGIIQGETPDDTAALLSELEGSTADILNRHASVFNAGAWQYYFEETMPVKESSFGLRSLKTTMMSAFQSSVTIASINNISQAKQ